MLQELLLKIVASISPVLRFPNANLLYQNGNPFSELIVASVFCVATCKSSE